MSEEWGSVIDGMHYNPSAPVIMHRFAYAGACYPAVCLDCCGCGGIKSRSYLWLGESFVEENFPVCNPCYLCCCTNKFCDCVSKKYLDGFPFVEACFGLLSPGYADEGDLTYFAFCIPFECFYDILCRPCFGGCVAIVPCPNPVPGDDSCCNGFCYTLSTRCCPCCMCPLFRFLAPDHSNSLKVELFSQATKVAQGGGANHVKMQQNAPGKFAMVLPGHQQAIDMGNVAFYNTQQRPQFQFQKVQYKNEYNTGYPAQGAQVMQRH